MSTLTIKYKTPKHIYDFEIVIDDSVSNTIVCQPIQLNPFVYGNDEDIDTIIYPGSVDIEFSILYKVPSDPPNPFQEFNWSMLDSNAEYYRLNSVLAFEGTVVTIDRDGSEYMKGYIDSGKINGNYENKSFTLTVLSDFGKLKSLDPRALDPADYLSPPYDVSPGQQVLFTDLLLTLIQEVYPSITQVVLMSDVYSETVYTLLGVPQSVGAGYFGTFNYHYIGTSSLYESAAEIVKDILAAFGCVGVVIGNKFLMQSRFYYSQTKVTILKSQFVKGKGPAPFSSSKMDGMKVIVRPGGTFLTYEQWYGSIEKWIGVDGISGNFQLGETINWVGGNAKIEQLDISGTTGAIKIVTISSSDALADNETITGLTSGATASINGSTVGTEILNQENIEVLEIIAVGGDPPGVDGGTYPLLVRNIWLYIPAFITGLGYDTWVTSVRNSFYVTGGTKKPLWQCIADEIWALIQYDRIVYSTDVDGVDWEYNKYYSFQDSTLSLRPRKISFDDTTDTTNLELIQG